MYVKRGLLANIVVAILWNTTPTISGMGRFSLSGSKVNSKGDPSHIGFWGRMIDAFRKLPSNTVGQSANDANVVLQAIRRTENVGLPNIPRVRQPQSGNSLGAHKQWKYIMDLLKGPFEIPAETSLWQAGAESSKRGIRQNTWRYSNRSDPDDQRNQDGA